MNTKAHQTNTDKSSLLTEDIVTKLVEFLGTFPTKSIKTILPLVKTNMSDKDKLVVLAFLLKSNLGAQVYYVVFGSIDLTGEGKDVPIEEEVIERIKTFLEDYPYNDMKEILGTIDSKMEVKDKLAIVNYLISKEPVVFMYHMIFNSVDFAKLERENMPNETDSAGSFDIVEEIDLPMPSSYNKA